MRIVALGGELRRPLIHDVHVLTEIPVVVLAYQHELDVLRGAWAAARVLLIKVVEVVAVARIGITGTSMSIIAVRKTHVREV